MPKGTKRTKSAPKQRPAKKAPPIAPEGRQGARQTRAQVARALGVSIATVRRMVDRRELRSTIVGGVHWFRMADVEQLRAGGAFASSSSSAGQLAARVFLALEAGKTVAQIVIAEQLEPAIALELFEQWKASSGAIGLSAVQVQALESLGVDVAGGAMIVASVVRLREAARARRDRAIESSVSAALPSIAAATAHLERGETPPKTSRQSTKGASTPGPRSTRPLPKYHA